MAHWISLRLMFAYVQEHTYSLFEVCKSDLVCVVTNSSILAIRTMRKKIRGATRGRGTKKYVNWIYSIIMIIHISSKLIKLSSKSWRY